MQKQPNAPWTEKELALLKKLYPDMNNEDISCFIDRTPSAIAHKASKIKLRKSEAFINSAKSGRFVIQYSLKQRLINWLRSCFN